MTKQKFADGIHDISNAAYHASEGVSRSRLMQFQKSPQHYLNPKQFKGSPSMNLGSLVHCLLLEPDLFDDEFAVAPVVNKRTKAGKEEWESFEAKNEGKSLVTDEQFAIANDMCASVLRNNEAAKLLSMGALAEQSIYWTDEETQIQFKSRPDLWHRESGLIIDLKTTIDASPHAFSGSAWKYGYFLQAIFAKKALESLGEEMRKFIIIAVENTEPYVPAIYVIDDESIAFATEQFHKLARGLKECIETDRWGCFGINLLSMPAWVRFDSL